ncbi:AraC family transcriptional regulator [Iamia sp. SCSIO 61187]|uniref:helix-turn-helix domain-containing protein n=1 Tax=Iamia sp. SCSIO 61187 TaxID=2722752 RepID=UPI001C63160C|nr:helix-turn-helix domain-containing protein [Iamia sp. SCSIO 61187]QYG93071.1 AraC family transcriptional regulator [Iamia sp. SCSIO 61187]
MERDPRGLGGAWAEHQSLSFPDPPPDLAPWVERLWAVSWSYNAPYRQVLLPHAQVHLTFPSDTVPTITGAATRARQRVLDGDGAVVGVAFRPGVVRPLVGRSVSSLTDLSIPAADVLGPGLPSDPDPDEVVALLRRVLPAPDPVGLWCAEVVDRIHADTDLRRVGDLAASVGTSVRQLQRRFAEHVGVGPKWIIRRRRLHEVTERLAAGERVDWAGLAAELGYADQAHLTRDVTSLFGEPPTAHAARY